MDSEDICLEDLRDVMVIDTDDVNGITTYGGVDDNGQYTTICIDDETEESIL